jgi:outer membrane protein
MRRFQFWLGGTAAVAAVVMTMPAQAESLRDAMVAAYSNNPVLAGARAGQQATSERLVQAEGQIKPTINSRTVLDQATTSPGEFNDLSRLFTVGVELRQPVYRGGQIQAGIKAADKRVEAGAEQLRATENSTIFETVRAYTDVLRTQAELELTANQVKVLERQLQASRDRFEVGDLTRTDVAQSEARLARAQSLNIAATGNLANAKATYERVVGHAPVDLEPAPPLPMIPGTREQAIDLAVNENPFLIAAKREQEAARYDVKQAKGARLPSVDATFNVGYTNYRGPTIAGTGIRTGDIDYTQNIGATMTIPIYQGGVQGSRIREAEARYSQAEQDAYATERTTIEDTRTAYENMVSARETIESSRIAVDANALALEGTRAENEVGSRTILDVLDAEQELLNSRVVLVRAERDAYVAAYALLATIGRAEADDLGLPVEIYRPGDYLRSAKRNWIDWAPGFDKQSITPAIPPASSTTAVPPAPASAGAQEGVTTRTN